jgi:hypothetical protein
MDSDTYPYYLRDNYSLLLEHKQLWADFTHLYTAIHGEARPAYLYGSQRSCDKLTSRYVGHTLLGWQIWWIGNAGFCVRQIRSNTYIRQRQNKPHHVVKFDVRSDAPDLERYPLFQKAKGFDCVVEPGEIIIVPSNWAHWVISLEATLSLTHNYMGPGNFRSAFEGNLKWYLETAKRRFDREFPLDCGARGQAAAFRP